MILTYCQPVDDEVVISNAKLKMFLLTICMVFGIVISAAVLIKMDKLTAIYR